MEQTIPINPLISVIIPVYNVSQFLDRCLESVVHQTYRNLEIILINDGSTDSSGSLCDEWAKKDHRIRVLHTSNSGAAAARNCGLDIATGKYILFVDADDYVSKSLCSILLESMDEGQQIDCTICGLAFVDDSGPVGTPQAVAEPVVMTGTDALKERYLKNKNTINIIGPCGKLYRKQLWDNTRFTNGIYYEDLDIAPYIFTKCRNVFCIPEIGYFYYQRTGSASHGEGTDDKRYLDSLKIREKHIAFYDEHSLPEISVVIRKMLMELIITSSCNGWIPVSARAYSKKLFAKTYYSLFLSGDISLKDKLRFSLYKIGGRYIYGWATQKKQKR